MGKRPEDIRHLVIICHGSDCAKKGAKSIGKQARRTLRDLGVKKETLVTRTKCNGMCKLAPIACLQPHDVWLEKTTPEEIDSALRAALDDSEN